MATHFEFKHMATQPAATTLEENHIFAIFKNREEYVVVSVMGVGSRMQAAERVSHIVECLRHGRT
jgi:hypothetical protein